MFELTKLLLLGLAKNKVVALYKVTFARKNVHIVGASIVIVSIVESF